jgi:hypothetical protein
MRDIEQFVRSLADQERGEIIDRLMEADAAANKIVASGGRARRGTAEYDQIEHAKQHVERFGRIIYFLRFRITMEKCSASDLELCELLAAKLASKGQWNGKFSPPQAGSKELRNVHQSEGKC